MPTELLESALKLSVEERLRLVEEIWDSIAATQEAVPLTQAGSPREEVKAHLLTPSTGIRRAQALVRSYIPEGRRLSDELVEERRKEFRIE